MQDDMLHRTSKKKESGNRYIIVKAGIFRTIQIAWSPIALAGYVPFAIKLIPYSRKSGVSSTALASLYTRWMQHSLGTRLDEPAVRLMMILPNISHLGLCLTTA